MIRTIIIMKISNIIILLYGFDIIIIIDGVKKYEI